jgi:hypothetical protein
MPNEITTRLLTTPPTWETTLAALIVYSYTVGLREERDEHGSGRRRRLRLSRPTKRTLDLSCGWRQLTATVFEDGRQRIATADLDDLLGTNLDDMPGRTPWFGEEELRCMLGVMRFMPDAEHLVPVVTELLEALVAAEKSP